MIPRKRERERHGTTNDSREPPPDRLASPRRAPGFERGHGRRDAFRRAVIVAVAFSLATVLLAVSYLVGRHFAAAWWLESMQGAVLWEIDATNWRQGGETTVELTSRRSSNPKASNIDLTHLSKLHRVVSLNLSENDRITNKGLALLRLDCLTDLNLERMERDRKTPTPVGIRFR